MNCAVIIAGIVVNVIVADCARDAVPGAQIVAVQAPDSAGIGHVFDGTGFIEPRPYPSWLLVNRKWVSPIPRPADGFYVWHEQSLSWIRVGNYNAANAASRGP